MIWSLGHCGHWIFRLIMMKLSKHFRSPNPKLPADNHRGSLRLEWQGPIHPQSCKVFPGSATATHGQSLPCAAVYWLIELVVTRHCFKSIMVWEYVGSKVFSTVFVFQTNACPRLANKRCSTFWFHLCIHAHICCNIC